ncbi:MAG: hypothetical protein LWX08_09215, partial [Deltaproteobacteria bacterium]|nr:hypothetical protein [Deltaproteobacteria bacterium]
MKKKKTKDVLQLYHYLDEEGLNSLYAQCGQFLIESLTDLKINGKLDGDATIEIPKLLSMVGLGGAKIGGKISLNRLKSESFKSIFRVEQRISLILDHLRKQGNLCEFAQSDAVTIKDDGYVLLESEFKAPNFRKVIEYSKAEPKRAMFSAFFGDKEMSRPKDFVQFVSHTAAGIITMGTSLEKYKTGLPHLKNM